MSRITEIPSVDENVPEPVAKVLRALKHNFEVLAGLTGDDKVDRAIAYGEVRVADMDPQQSAAAAGAAPTKAEFDAAVADITAIRDRCNYLIALLRGETVGG